MIVLAGLVGNLKHMKYSCQLLFGTLRLTGSRIEVSHIELVFEEFYTRDETGSLDPVFIQLVRMATSNRDIIR